MTGKWPPFVTITDFNFNLEILFFMFYSFVVYVSGYIFFFLFFMLQNLSSTGGLEEKNTSQETHMGRLFFIFP